MHIVLTVNAAWNAWNFRRGLIRALLQDGHLVTILAPRDHTVDKLVEIGCTFEHLEMQQSGISPLRDTVLIASLRKTFSRLNPDMILSYTVKNNVFGAMAARSLAIPFIPNVTGLGTAFLGSSAVQKIVQSLYRYTFRKLPVVFFQNADDQALFVESGLVSADQTRLLPGSGIDLSEYTATPIPDSKSETIFLMVSRLLRDKGIREYIAAAAMVRANHPGAIFQILGPDGAPNPSAVPLSDIEEAAASGAIEYLGATDDVRPFVERAHCIVLPSYREGAPRSLIEAAALGRPLIAADVPGSRSVINHGQSGLLCAVRDDISLAATFESFLVMDHAERTKMGAASRTKMENEFDEQLVIAAYRLAINQLTKKA